LGELVTALRLEFKTCLESDESSFRWNGLTRNQNGELFRSSDPHAITGLVMTGMFNKAVSNLSGRLEIELVHGSLTQVEAVDAIAVGAFRNVPISGAARELDQLLSGRISIALKAGNKMVAISTPEIDADWVQIADLGEIDAERVSNLPALVERSAGEVADDAIWHGFNDLATVTFGSSVGPNLKAVVDRMLKGFSRLAGRCVIHWFELDEARFQELLGLLTREDVNLTTRVGARRPTIGLVQPGRQDVIVTVRYDKDLLSTTVVPPAGTAAVRTVRSSVPEEALRALCQVGADQVPTDQASLGDELGRLLFEADGHQLFSRFLAARVIIQHDLESAVIPFECLRSGGKWLSLQNVMTRRPSLHGLRLSEVEPRPPRVGKLNLQLVINPTGDLPGALAEGNALIQMIGKNHPRINLLEPLVEAAASKAAILRALSNPLVDIFHYCGHAFYEGTEEDQSGLLAANKQRILPRDLVDCKIAARLVFFNACQSARLRQQPTQEASRGFAEFCLRSPLEAYIGTFWPVGDQAAARFASGIYADLALGKALDEAVQLARRNLEQAGHADWANYLLFGDGSFRFIAPNA
jgi:hypothetical protein